MFLLILYSRCTGQELSCNAVGSCSLLPFVFCQTALINVFPICRRELCRVLKLGNVIEEKVKEIESLADDLPKVYKKKLEEDIRCPLEYESESVDGGKNKR